MTTARDNPPPGSVPDSDSDGDPDSDGVRDLDGDNGNLGNAAGEALVLTDDDLALGLRPLTARSLLASVLLGTHPPRLPVRVLVAAAGLFGISGGSARTALSRMLATGEITAESGWYALGPVLAVRQASQDRGRHAGGGLWDGLWRSAMITVERRSPGARTEARSLLRRARLVELHEGIWVRPTNLPDDPQLDDLADRGWLLGVTRFDSPPAVSELWPLADWGERAAGLRAAMDELMPALKADDRSVLARGFVVAAAGLRLFRDDPLLPSELLPEDWPGVQFRTAYDAFDDAYRQVLRRFFDESR